MGNKRQRQTAPPERVDQTPVPDSEPARDPSGAAGAGPLTTQAVLELQHSIGNHAVQRLLESQQRGGRGVQRDPIDPDVDVRSPVAESLFNQLSVVQAAFAGRSLTGAERALARPTFGSSLDLSRVRIIEGDVLAGTTVGNNIRLHQGFDIGTPADAQLLIHELTHVWQYQHNGTDYISESLHTQIIGHLETGNRNAAYDYVTDASRSFFDFTPEQQAFIVENHFAMQRDQALIAGGGQSDFRSNHLGDDGFRRPINARRRQAEITAELPIHVTYLQQMQQALPRTEAQLLLRRGEDVMRMPLDDLMSPDLRTAPITPLLEIRFPGL